MKAKSSIKSMRTVSSIARGERSIEGDSAILDTVLRVTHESTSSKRSTLSPVSSVSASS
jgi:hypothetical protein